jgi:hypothetical protein
MALRQAIKHELKIIRDSRSCLDRLTTAQTYLANSRFSECSRELAKAYKFERISNNIQAQRANLFAEISQIIQNRMESADIYYQQDLPNEVWAICQSVKTDFTNLAGIEKGAELLGQVDKLLKLLESQYPEFKLRR